MKMNVRVAYLVGSHSAFERARDTFIFAFTTKIPGDNSFRVIKCLRKIQDKDKSPIINVP